jgi:hypothetical protein
MCAPLIIRFQIANSYICGYCTVHYSILIYTGKKGGGGSYPGRILEGQCFTKLVENTNMTDCMSDVQSKKFIKHQ